MQKHYIRGQLSHAETIVIVYIMAYHTEMNKIVALMWQRKKINQTEHQVISVKLERESNKQFFNAISACLA